MSYSEEDVKEWIKHNAIPTVSVDPKWKREHWIAHMANTNNWTEGAELGVWKGRTFLHLLKTCPQLTLHGVDLWAPQPDNPGPQQYTGPEWDHAKFEAGVRSGAAPYGERAIIHKLSTHDASTKIADNSLDFVFIDADHSAEAVRQDIMNWAPKLKASGWIIGHDINWPPVKQVVDELVPGYIIGPDNVWARPVMYRERSWR